MFEEVKARLDLFCDFEVGNESLKGLLEQEVPVLMNHVAYFGLMQQAVYERLQWEVKRAKDGDGPVLGSVWQ